MYDLYDYRCVIPINTGNYQIHDKASCHIYCLCCLLETIDFFSQIEIFLSINIYNGQDILWHTVNAT